MTKINQEGWYKTSKKYFCIEFSDFQTVVINEMFKIRTFLAGMTHYFNHELKEFFRLNDQRNTEKENVRKLKLRTCV